MKSGKYDPCAPDDLFEECRRLSHLLSCKGAVVEVRDGWAHLWSEHVDPGTSSDVGIHIVMHLAVVAWGIAFSDHNLELGLKRLDFFFRHPRFADADRLLSIEMSYKQAWSYLYSNRELEAYRIYREFLNDDDRGVRSFTLRHLLMQLFAYCMHRPPADVSPPELTDLMKIAAQRRRLSQKVLRMLWEKTTNADLCDVIRRCFPPAEREHAAMVAAQACRWQVSRQDSSAGQLSNQASARREDAFRRQRRSWTRNSQAAAVER